MKIHSTFRNCSSAAKRIALAALITGSTIVGSLSENAIAASATQPAAAPVTGGISILVHRFDESAQPIAPLVATPGTHDSAPMIASPKPAEKKIAEEAATIAEEEVISSEPEVTIAIPTVQHRTSAGFNEMLAAAAASTAAKIGIPLEQFLEPFAMIQTQAGDSSKSNESSQTSESSQTNDTRTALAPVAGTLDVCNEDIVADHTDLAEAVALNRWWLEESVPASANNEIVPRAEVVPKATLDLREELAALAAEEPLDVTLPRVILPIVTKHDVSPVRIVQNHIVNDIVANDVVNEIVVNDVVDRGDELVGSSPMIVTLEEAYLPYDLNPADIELIEYVKASPDCLLDEAVHQTTRLANHVQSWSVAGLGDALASITSRRVKIQADLLASASDEIASVFASVVPTMLVDGEVVPQPTPDSAPDTIHSIDTMVVAGDVIPAPVPDSVPDEVSTDSVIAVMLVDGNLVPAPTPDAAPDASEPEPAMPMMLVDGAVIPVPTPDGIPNGMESYETETGIASIVAVDVVTESAYPTLDPASLDPTSLDPASLMDSETQIATRAEENVQR